MLTHHTLQQRGHQTLSLAPGGEYRLDPGGEAGSGAVQEKQKDYLSEIIEQMNGLFEGRLTEGDQLVYVDGVLKGKLLENELLGRQALSNSKAQFDHSPDFDHELLNALMDTSDAHRTMSRQALASERVRRGLREVLLGPGRLYEALRARWGGDDAAPRA